LKRGPGGIVDIEFLVQLLQLKYGREYPEMLRSNVWEALEALKSVGLIPDSDATTLSDAYSFLRLVEARLRVVTDRPLTEVPDRPEDKAKLARRLGFDSTEKFLLEFKRIQTDIRHHFEAITSRERN
jgi:[glutamine synthetase] adenylyltransferase / [glutamine synthetase]-adenylyl-L-tyrosine phosphorylase